MTWVFFLTLKQTNVARLSPRTYTRRQTPPVFHHSHKLFQCRPSFIYTPTHTLALSLSTHRYSRQPERQKLTDTQIRELLITHRAAAQHSLTPADRSVHRDRAIDRERREIAHSSSVIKTRRSKKERERHCKGTRPPPPRNVGGLFPHSLLLSGSGLSAASAAAAARPPASIAACMQGLTSGCAASPAKNSARPTGAASASRSPSSAPKEG